MVPLEEFVMYLKVLGEQSDFHMGAQRLLICGTMMLLLVAVVMLPQCAMAQAPSRPGGLGMQDQVLIRNIYRYRPELADRLAKAIGAADGYQESRRIVKEFKDRLQKEYNDTINLPKNLVDNDHMDRYATEYLFVEQYLDVMSNTIERYSNKYQERFDLEDDVIKKANFKDYKELYDFLRKKYPKNWGYGFLAELERLRKNDRASYVKALHHLIDELKEFRGPSSNANSPCKVICNHPAQSPQSRAWCKAHCRDGVSN